MDSLVAVAIHDAKNSLHALNVWLAQAERDCPSSPALMQAQAVAARVCGRLTELLALYRAGEGTLRLAVEDRYLDNFLDDVMAELGPPHGIVVATDFAAAGEIGGWAFDAFQVKFVLLDALRNALRHAAGQVRFSLAREQNGGIRFSVVDDGPGYPAEVLAGTAATMTDTSSGLGLAFARLIAGRHLTPDGRCGRIELANDGGARFSLVLP